jgi:hypothetical protein
MKCETAFAAQKLSSHLEREVFPGSAECRQILLQRRGQLVVPGRFFAWAGQHISVFDHIRWSEIADIRPNVVLLDLRDLIRFIHHTGQHCLALFFRPAGPNVPPDPNLTVGGRTAEKALTRGNLSHLHLDEVPRRTCLLAVNAGDRVC